MLSKTKKTAQLGFYATYEEQLDHGHALYKLSHCINWSVFETAFAKHYSEKMGKPAKPIRLMVSLLILKQVRNLSDESVVEQWAENSYYQYFSGESCFTPGKPCVPTELVEFRKRIGSEGAELIFQQSIKVNGRDAEDDNLSGDTTIQEKNITYPTDDKLYKKIIHKCRQMAEDESITLRQSYKQTEKKLSTIQRFKNTKKGAKNARKASKKIKTIAGVLVRELKRKLPSERLNMHNAQLALFEKILRQKRNDSDKTYSLHEPHVKCYTKGKAHKKFEFGSKVSVLVTQKTGVIVGAQNINSNAHDSKTMQSALDQYEKLNERKAKHVYVDRGYRGLSKINNTEIHPPKPQADITRSKRKRHSRRAAIEPVIGHLKQDYRMNRNFLKGITGDEINVLMAAAAMNFKRVMNLWRTEAILSWELIQFFILNVAKIFIPQKLKWSF